MTENYNKSTSIFQDYGEGVPTLPLGTVVAGNYEVKAVIGHGGMSMVYLVHQSLLGRDFALKVLDVRKQSETSVRRFQQEARTASQLKHPNLVAVHDFGLISKTEPFLIMDYVSGPTLSDFLRRRGTLPVADAVALIIQVAFGLMYAHSKHIVHRDIKPGNIMLLNPQERAREGTVKIVDFGIAKLMQSEDGEIQGLTRTGEIFGSPIYMSPEQCRGGAVDQRTDIFSLGCVFFECLTGAPPFVGDTAMSTMVMRLTQSPKTLRDATGGFDFAPELETLVQKMLMTEPADRYQQMSELIEDLMKLQHETKLVTKPKPLVKYALPAAPTNSRFKERAIIFSTTALCAIAGTVLYDFYTTVWTSKPPDQNVPAQAPLQSDITKKFIPPTCKPVPGGYAVKFTSACGTFSVREKEFAAEDSEVFVPDNAPVEFRIEEDAGGDPATLVNLAPLNFSVIEFRNRYRVDNKAVTALAQVPHIRALILSGCDNITSLEPIYDRKFKHLGVYNTFLTSDEILKMKHLNELRSFDFGPNHAPDSVLTKFAELNTLTRLQYRGPNVKDAAPDGRGLNHNDVKLIGKMTNLEHLDLKGSASLDDDCVKELVGLSKLEFLTLHDCHVTAASLPTFKKMHLKILDITPVGWSDADIQKLMHVAPKVVLADSDVQRHNNDKKRNMTKFSDAEELY